MLAARLIGTPDAYLCRGETTAASFLAAAFALIGATIWRIGRRAAPSQQSASRVSGPETRSR